MKPTQKRTARDLVASHPLLDLLPITLLCLLIAWAGVPLPNSAARLGLYQSAGAFAGLALATATFACSMTYQSSNVLLSRARSLFGPDIRRNWQSVILWLLAAAAAPLASFILEGHRPRVAVAITLASILVTIVKVLRAAFWLRYTLFMDEVQARKKSAAVAPPKLPERV